PRVLDANERLLFCVDCISGRMNKVGRYTRGVLVGTSAGRMWFLGRKNFRVRSELIPVQDVTVESRKRLLFNEVLVRTHGEDGVISLRFGKHYTNAMEELTDWMRVRCANVQAEPVTAELVDPSVG